MLNTLTKVFKTTLFISGYKSPHKVKSIQQFSKKLYPFHKNMVLSPKESGKFVVENAKFLNVNEKGIQKLTDEVLKGLKSKEIDIENFSQHDLHPKPTSEHAVDWIFVIDTLNFCFWTPGDATKWKVENYTGYFALCAAVNRAMKDGVDITNPEYYSKITLDELKEILRSDDGKTEAPLLEERVKCLHEVGSKLIDKYEGKFENVVRECKNSAVTLMNTVVEEFPCFRDEAEYKGKKVAIYKRAQILVGDLWACFRGEKIGHFEDIDKITMFADYRVPQVLVHFGALEYSPELMDILKADQLLESGAQEEVEIRAASIHIVELLKERVLDDIKKNNPEISPKNVNAILLDHFLWDYRRKNAMELEYIPFHKTLGVYY